RCGPRCARCGAKAPAGASVARRIPRVPVRHWVLSLPSPQRFEWAGDRAAEGAIARAFVRAIFGRLRGGADEKEAGCGAVVAIHRHGSALDLNLHVHALVVDGVFCRDGENARFRAHSLDQADLAAVAEEVRAALGQVRGAGEKEPSLARLQRAARRRRVAVRGSEVHARRAGMVCDMAGLRVFAGAPLSAEDRAGLRRICDYVTRPASARLSRGEGNADALAVPLPPQPDGATHAILEAGEVVGRLAAGMPEEPAISVRTFGVLAPRAAHEWQLTHGRQLELPAVGHARTSSPPRPRAPRCRRCDVALEAVAVEDRSDPATGA
ncbi:MAG TPA: transposase, partial [Nannocystis sp.]